MSGQMPPEAPCLSNKLVACVPTGQAEELAQAARAAVRGTWQAIAQRVCHMLPPGIQQDSARMARYELQVQQHLAVDFAHLPMDLPVAEMQGLAQGVTQETPLTRALQQLAAGTESARYAAVYYLVDHCMNAVLKLNGFTARNAGAGRDAGWYAVRKHFFIKPAGSKGFGDFRLPAVTTSLLTACARRLKEYRRDLGVHPTLGKGQKAREGAYYGTSALGNAIGGRQTSALRFRPVLIENKLFLYLLKTPDITLGVETRKHNLVLH